ncbi:MAG: efflux transporter outer membrane subunit [Telluria sp.]
MKKTTLELAAAAAVLLLAGCAHVPADRHPAAPDDVARTALPADIRLAAEGWPDAQWWRQYGDPQLDALVERALKGSPSLGAAAARIATAETALTYEEADGGLDVNLNAGMTRQRYSANGLFPQPIGGNWFTSETIQLQTRYDVDWWGRNKQQVAAVAGELNARRAEYALAEQALAAQVAQSYFGMQAALARSAKLGELEKVQEAAVTDRQRRIAAGLAPSGEQQSARAALADTRQQRTHVEALARREREALRALLGAGPDDLPQLAARPLPVLPEALPPRLGIELLARRADLQAARWRVESTLSKIEVARIAFYPDLNLSGAIGLDSISLGKLLTWGSRTIAFGPALTMPIFDSTRLEAKIDAARGERNEAIADYNQRVVAAVQSVAQAAVDVQDAARQLAEHQAATDASAALLRGAQARMKQGLVDHGAELTAEAALLRQQDATLQLAAQRVLAEVALVRALGGGYRNDTSIAQDTTTK